MIKFNREITNKFEEATTREWFVTNGLGGYAAGTISGVLTRRYHGLLVAALDPPLSRTLMASKIDEIVTCDGEEYILSANIWGDRTADLEGLKFIEEFYLDGTIPTWIYELGGPRLRKQIWMLSGENTTYIRYELDKTTSFLDLRLNAILNLRDHHGLTSTENPMIQLEMTERGVKVSNREGISAYIFSRGAEIELTNQWKQYYLRIEDYRGFDALEYGLQGCTFNTRLRGGESLTVAISIRPDPLLGGNRALDGRKEYERLILDLVDGKNLSSMERQLVLAADQFIVERVSENIPDGKSVIAGFPWFEDWGRDTMIALPGLTLATGRPEVAKQILETFSTAIDK
ncbi:MAG: glycogen debranching enzyme N-terminal domain-containing protein, partial [Anaerolineales bacterium]